MPDREDGNVVSLNRIQWLSQNDPQASSGKVLNGSEESKPVNGDADEFIFRLLIKESRDRTAETFGSRPGLIDSYRNRRVRMKADELLQGMISDRAVLIAVLRFVGCPLPFSDAEMIAVQKYRDAVKASIQADAITESVDAYLKPKEA